MHIIHPSTFIALALSATTLAQTVSTITLAPTPQPTSPSYTSDSVFRNEILAAHNFYRLEHNASALVWNETSADFAANWAEDCEFKHSNARTGENLAAGYPNASASVDGWGLERLQYNWDKPGFAKETGHFTQLVWSNTTSVGCARESCQGENNTPGWYVVCEYYPPGNVVGNNNQFFRDNVKRQTQGRKEDTVATGVTSGAVRMEGWGDARWSVIVLGAAGLVGLGLAW